MSVAVAVMPSSDYSGLTQALRCMQQRKLQDCCAPLVVRPGPLGFCPLQEFEGSYGQWQLHAAWMSEPACEQQLLLKVHPSF